MRAFGVLMIVIVTVLALSLVFSMPAHATPSCRVNLPCTTCPSGAGVCDPCLGGSGAFVSPGCPVEHHVAPMPAPQPSGAPASADEPEASVPLDCSSTTNRINRTLMQCDVAIPTPQATEVARPDPKIIAQVIPPALPPAILVVATATPPPTARVPIPPKTGNAGLHASDAAMPRNGW